MHEEKGDWKTTQMRRRLWTFNHYIVIQ